jgi:hypothetical protein
MVSLTSLLDARGKAEGNKRGEYVVTGDARKQLVADIQKLAAQVKQLAGDAMAKAATPAEKARHQARVANTTLTIAELAAGEQNDPKATLAGLANFEREVEGLADAKDMLNRALFLRVKSFMGAGQYNEATNALVSLLDKTGGQAGQEIVLGLLQRLNEDYDKAAAADDAKGMATLAQNRARLSGFLVDWAGKSNKPDVRKFVYSYSVYDAESKRLAGTLTKDPKALRDAMDAFQKLQTPPMVALYKQEVAGNPKADPNYPHPNVLLGLGLTAFELKDYKTARDHLGRLLNDRKLGTAQTERRDEKTNETVYADNATYWEAWYKLLRSHVELSKQNKEDAALRDGFETAKTGLTRLYVRGDVGGQKWRDEFDALRREIAPDFDPKSLIAPATPAAAATQPVAASGGTR